MLQSPWDPWLKSSILINFDGLDTACPLIESINLLKEHNERIFGDR